MCMIPVNWKIEISPRVIKISQKFFAHVERKSKEIDMWNFDEFREKRFLFKNFVSHFFLLWNLSQCRTVMHKHGGCFINVRVVYTGKTLLECYSSDKISIDVLWWRWAAHFFWELCVAVENHSWIKSNCSYKAFWFDVYIHGTEYIAHTI